MFVLPNLQLLTGTANIEKQDGLPAEWIETAFPSEDKRATYLAENFEKVPVMMIPLLADRMTDTTPVARQASRWGSILPGVWSFMLALRSRGLGSAWTTLHLIGDGEKQAAEVVGIPFDKYAQGGLFPIAYTKGTDFKKARRLPAEQLTHWNHW